MQIQICMLIITCYAMAEHHDCCELMRHDAVLCVDPVLCYDPYDTQCWILFFELGVSFAASNMFVVIDDIAESKQHEGVLLICSTPTLCLSVQWKVERKRINLLDSMLVRSEQVYKAGLHTFMHV